MSAARASSALVPHPDHPAPAVRGVRVDVTRTANGLALAYVLEGDLDAIRIPAPATPVVVHGLWEHTCFEAFVAADGAAAYHEMNLAPSGAWAAFAFLGFLGTGVAFVWFYQGVQRLGPARTAVFVNLVPVFAIALGVLLLGERVDASMLIGGAIVIAGVWLLNRPQSPSAAPAPA